MCFAASASGQKLRPVVVIPRVNPLKGFIPPDNVIVVYDRSGNFNETVISEGFVTRALLPEILAQNLKNSTLILDHATCHTSKRVKAFLESHNISPIYVPKRLTNLLQPADVSWMRPLKEKFKDRWMEWMLHADKSFTPQGNMRSPGYATAITWVSEIWAELDTQIIIDSFDLCGITQSNLRKCHQQLQAFVQKGLKEMVVDQDGTEDMRGFDVVEQVAGDIGDSESESDESDEED